MGTGGEGRRNLSINGTLDAALWWILSLVTGYGSVTASRCPHPCKARVARSGNHIEAFLMKQVSSRCSLRVRWILSNPGLWVDASRSLHREIPLDLLGNYDSINTFAGPLMRRAMVLKVWKRKDLNLRPQVGRIHLFEETRFCSLLTTRWHFCWVVRRPQGSPFLKVNYTESRFMVKLIPICFALLVGVNAAASRPYEGPEQWLATLQAIDSLKPLFCPASRLKTHKEIIDDQLTESPQAEGRHKVKLLQNVARTAKTRCSHGLETPLRTQQSPATVLLLQPPSHSPNYCQCKARVQTLVTFLYLLTSAVGAPVDAAKARASLCRPESLPCLSIEVDGATICVTSASPSDPPLPPNEHGPDGPPTIPLTKGIERYSECTQISLRLGASVIDRTQCLDLVVEHFRRLKSAIDEFNEANLNVASACISYAEIERYYGARHPPILKTMRCLRDSIIAPMDASSSFSSL
ncbi:hypothetical protein BKA70DRAFT_1240817 [Coprinopsis sp. MPI-PUGE-AT-0042]|nr:hypothetical protein BKA70DRAFT_1240817 [Coprinopsis sp. MPI-PUGE-AT-0042]